VSDSAEGDTEVASGDTVAAGDSQGDSVRIRPSQTLRPPAAGGADYADLVVVDPAHYVLERELARGGMGRIQLARDRRLGREVAVKEVLATTGAIVRRFEREARITARLQHPSIVAVHEAGTWPSGEPFYAMRLVAGRALEDAITAARSFDERLALLPHVLAIADAMAYAHGQRVIHRDLKPRNVLVGEFGETVVIDWGLAKELDATETSVDGSPPVSGASGVSRPGETTAGDVLGTPAYMPPEQAAGKPVDERADVYAIGAILYHLLAGRAPYVAESSAELIAAVHGGPPEPLPSPVPAELVAIVERAMARDAAARYPSGRELADDLRRFQTGQLVGAHRYSLRQLLRRWMRRHRTAIVATAAAAVAAIAIGVFALTRVIAANHRAVENQKHAEELMQFMLVDLREKLAHDGRVDLLDAVARRASAYYDARGHAASDEDEYLATLARQAVGQVIEAKNDLAAARAEYEKAVASAEALAKRHPGEPKYAVLAASVSLALARTIKYGGDLPGSTAAVHRALAYLDPVLHAHPTDPGALRDASSAHLQLGSILQRQGNVKSALDEGRAAVDLANRRAAVATDDAGYKAQLNAHAALGKMLDDNNDAKGALAEFRLALEIGQRLVARDPKAGEWLEDVAVSHDEVGSTLAELGDRDGALAEVRQGAAIADQLQALDPANGDWIDTRSAAHEKVGILLMEAKDYAHAREEYELCMKLHQELVARDPTSGDHQRGLALMTTKLGDVRLATGDVAGAIEQYRQSLSIREQLVAKDPTSAQWRRDLFYGHYKLAAALAQAPRGEEQAAAELRAALAIAKDNAARFPQDDQYPRDVAGTQEVLAGLLQQMHDLAGAREQLEAAVALARQREALPGVSPEWHAMAARYAAELAKL
jgi:tetratricopeptide (TPR) repeat protein